MSNLYSQLSQVSNFILLQTAIVLVVGFNNHALAQLKSVDGNLIIRQLRSYQDACATGKPSDSYQVKNGVSGFLYPSECGKGLGEDALKYKFVDTGGNEKCTGEAIVGFGGVYGGGATAVIYWEVQDAVSGYNCSTVGETYEIRMQ